MGLDSRIQELAATTGADFFGVADLTSAHQAILEQGGAQVAAFPRAVSVGVALFHSIVDQLPQRSDPAVAKSYRHHCYDIVNQRLDHIVSRLSSLLQSEGYSVLPVPASQMVDGERLYGIFSNKMAAHLAGAGNVKKYLRSNGAHDVQDAYGTTITHYLKRFKGYDTSSIPPRKNPKIL